MVKVKDPEALANDIKEVFKMFDTMPKSYGGVWKEKMYIDILKWTKHDNMYCRIWLNVSG